MPVTHSKCQYYSLNFAFSSKWGRSVEKEIVRIKDFKSEDTLWVEKKINFNLLLFRGSGGMRRKTKHKTNVMENSKKK